MEPRRDTLYPILDARDIDRVRPFAFSRRWRDGARMASAGQRGAGMLLLLSGEAVLHVRDGLGRMSPLISQGAGQFYAELGHLSDDFVSLADLHAVGDVEALVVPPARLRALIIAEADLGGRVMHTLIMRRAWLIAGGVAGPVLVGRAGCPALLRLRTFLARNGRPHHVLDPERDPDGAALLACYRPTDEELPLVVGTDGAVLRNPTAAELAVRLGMVRNIPDRLYDVAVVGAGPAGLATAVYAASEGLSVIVLDASAVGGQAGASMRIENYLGFPSGISGLELAGNAFAQAQKFGAEVLVPVEVVALDCACIDAPFALHLECGARVRARAVVVASGARYRRPAIPDLETYEGRGVWYWASPIEARLCSSREVVLVGGGNSAGQAAVFLAEHAAHVRLLVRGEGLAASMSRYLIERLAATSNVELMIRTELVALEGERESGLERVRWRNVATGAEDGGTIANVFLFIGAEPATSWLPGCSVALDRAGFIVTRPGSLASSVPGVFAVGDVRAGSVKRVGSAIGEGAQVVAALHGYLESLATGLHPSRPWSREAPSSSPSLAPVMSVSSSTTLR